MYTQDDVLAALRCPRFNGEIQVGGRGGQGQEDFLDSCFIRIGGCCGMYYQQHVHNLGTMLAYLWDRKNADDWSSVKRPWDDDAEPYIELLLHMMDSAGLIDHGTGIYASFLDDDGEVLAWTAVQFFEGKIHSLSDLPR